MNVDEHTQEGIALLNAAEGLIREEGADGWSLGDLAERAGVRRDTVQAAFETEWDAFCFVMRRDEERFEGVILEALPESPSERVLALLEACVPHYDWTFWIELWSLALRDDRANELRSQLDERFRNVIEQIVRDGVEAGEFSVSDTRATAITISSLIDAMALQATLGDTTIRPNYLLDAGVTVCAALLGAPLKLPTLPGASSA